MAWEPDYATSADLKAYLKIGDAVDDAQIAMAVTSASRAVDMAAGGRQFGQVATEESRSYTGKWDRHRGGYWVALDDLGDVDNLVVVAGGEEITDYTLYPLNALTKTYVYTHILTPVAGDLTVSGLWGWPAVPVTIKQATLLQASRFYARRESPYGVAGSPDDGSEVRLLAAADPDVRVMVRRYRRTVWAA